MGADLTRPETLPALFKGPVDRVFHLGAICNFSTPYVKLHPTNVAGVKALSKMALEKSVKSFVHVTSTSVYGRYGGQPFGTVVSDHALDITDREGVKQFRDGVLAKFGQVDTILSNVGIGFFGPFEEKNLEKGLKCMEINVIGAASIFQAFIPAMREQKSGKLIAMSSLVGVIPFPFESMYTASKFAIEGMMESIKYEVEPFGIKVALIEPAQVSTDFAAKIHKLPPEGSAYRERAQRFINRDNELIKTATPPEQAARKIVAVVLDHHPKLHNQVDFMSSFFSFSTGFCPKDSRI